MVEIYYSKYLIRIMREKPFSRGYWMGGKPVRDHELVTAIQTPTGWLGCCILRGWGLRKDDFKLHYENCRI